MVSAGLVSAIQAAVRLQMRYQTVWALMHRVRAALATHPIELDDNIVLVRGLLECRGTQLCPNKADESGYSSRIMLSTLLDVNQRFLVRASFDEVGTVRRMCGELGVPEPKVLRWFQHRPGDPTGWIERVLMKVHRSVSERWINLYLRALATLRAVNHDDRALSACVASARRTTWLDLRPPNPATPPVMSVMPPSVDPVPWPIPWSEV